VLAAPDPKLVVARLTLLKSTQIALKTGLSLLGIDVLERM